MSRKSRAKLVRAQRILTALDDAKCLRRSVSPQHALLAADTAVALARGAELGDVDLVDEGGAVAVAAVGLGVGAGHFVVKMRALVRCVGLFSGWKARHPYVCILRGVFLVALEQVRRHPPAEPGSDWRMGNARMVSAHKLTTPWW
jgi:hypothetical protein